MTQITLVVIGENTHTITTHWREIKELLLTQPFKSNPPHEYIILDLNRKLLINAQHTFTIPPLPIEKVDI